MRDGEGKKFGKKNGITLSKFDGTVCHGNSEIFNEIGFVNCIKAFVLTFYDNSL